MNQAANLPPDPDPRTGRGGQTPSRSQRPPAGQHPPERFTPSPWGRVGFTAGAVTTAFVIGVATGGVDLPRVAVFWAVMLPLVLLPLLTTKNKRLSAGHGWLRQGGQDFVATRALVSVEASERETNRTLQLVDSAGGEVSARLDHLRANPALWQLVHDDILHSVRGNGAETNELARTFLDLDNPLRFRGE